MGAAACPSALRVSGTVRLAAVLLVQCSHEGFRGGRDLVAESASGLPPLPGVALDALGLRGCAVTPRWSALLVGRNLSTDRRYR